MVSFDPKVNKDLFKIAGINPFAAGKVAFTGGNGTPTSGSAAVQRYENGLAPENSTGIYGGPADMGSGSKEIAKKFGFNELVA